MNVAKRCYLALAFLLTLQAARAADSLPTLELTAAFPSLKFNRPLWMEEIPDDSKRLIVIEQDGKIVLFPRDSGAKNPKTFLDLTPRRPHVQNEEGLLAFAFHPQFKSNGLLYLYYSQQAPKRSVLSEVHISKSDPDQADLSTERILLEIPQPYWNHNGGTLIFGPA